MMMIFVAVYAYNVAVRVIIWLVLWKTKNRRYKHNINEKAGTRASPLTQIAQNFDGRRILVRPATFLVKNLLAKQHFKTLTIRQFFFH